MRPLARSMYASSVARGWAEEMVAERSREGRSWVCGATAHRWLVLLLLWAFHVCEVIHAVVSYLRRVFLSGKHRTACRHTLILMHYLIASYSSSAFLRSKVSYLRRAFFSVNSLDIGSFVFI